MNYHKKLGDVLLDAGVVTPNQVEQALTIQTKTGERLGSILIDRGYISAAVIMEALEVQLGIPQVDLNSALFDPGLLTLIPADLARKYQVIPVCREGSRLMLAMVDPTNCVACDAIRMLTGYEIEPVIATERQVLEKFQQLFDPVELAAEVSGKAAGKKVNLAIKKQGRLGSSSRTTVLDFLLQDVMAERASHIHIEPQAEVVSVRICTEGKRQDRFTLSIDTYCAFVAQLKTLLEAE